MASLGDVAVPSPLLSAGSAGRKGAAESPAVAQGHGGISAPHSSKGCKPRQPDGFMNTSTSLVPRPAGGSRLEAELVLWAEGMWLCLQLFWICFI